MSRLFSDFRFFPFLAPDDAAGTATPSLSKEDTIDFLDKEDEPEKIELDKPPAKDGRGKKETKPEGEEEEDNEDPEGKEVEDELDEIEAELEGPPEEKLELVTPVRRKEILAKYPQLFKDFPQLENSYYRDQQFTEMFGTINDAKQVAEKASTLDKFEGEIMDGSIGTVLKAVREENPNSFHKLVDGYLTALAEVDERAYIHVIGNMTKHTIMAMVKEARRSNNDNLQSAAQILNQFVFGSSDFVHPTNLSKENPEEKEQTTKQDKREQEFMARQFTVAKDDLDGRVNNTIRNTIEAHIDPRQSMSDYVRKNATKDALETLGGILSRDTKFKSLTDKLWERCYQDNYSKESVDRIRSAFLSKAKTLLPSVIKKARQEALKGTGHRVREEDEEKTPKKGPIIAGAPRTQNLGKIKDAKSIPKGVTTLDFLNSE